MHRIPTREVLLALSLFSTIIVLTNCDLLGEGCDDGSFKECLSWSPDGTKIAFYSDGRVHVMNADGTGRVDLTDAWTYSGEPGHSISWSPDGTKIAFDCGPPVLPSSTQIYIANADGTGEVKRLANGESPSWSPDGTKIAFHSDGRVHVMNADGTGEVEYLANGESPSWSPDGTKIAFRASAQIYVVNADGTGKIEHLTEGYSLSWSPDGTKIAFGYGVCVMNADGTGEVERLADGESPSWSPDGTKIAFLRWCDIWGEHHSIYVMSPDGTNEEHLAD